MKRSRNMHPARYPENKGGMESKHSDIHSAYICLMLNWSTPGSIVFSTVIISF